MVNRSTSRSDQRPTLLQHLAWGGSAGVLTALFALAAEVLLATGGIFAASFRRMDLAVFVAGSLRVLGIYGLMGLMLGALLAAVSLALGLLGYARRGRILLLGLMLAAALAMAIGAGLRLHSSAPLVTSTAVLWGLGPLFAAGIMVLLRRRVAALARWLPGAGWTRLVWLLPMAPLLWWGITQSNPCARIERRIQEIPVRSGTGEAAVRAAERAPNVVLISMDTVRADALHCYGNERAYTPNLDRLASEGTRYANVSVPLPSTRPSHTSMMTGLMPQHHAVLDNLVSVLRQRTLTLAESLHAEGYATGAFVSSEVITTLCGLAQGFEIYDDCFAQGHALARSLPVPPGRLTPLRPGLRLILGDDPTASVRPGEETTARALEWLRHVQDRPFFLFLHIYDAHAPYLPKERFARRFLEPGDPPLESLPGRHMEPEEAPFWQRMYEAEVSQVDELVGRIMAAIEEYGLSEETLFIVTSDHGESFADGYYFEHSQRVFESLLRVPMIVRFPGRVAAGRLDRRLLSTIDLMPSVLAWTGHAGVKGFDGLNLGAEDASHATLRATSSFRERHDWLPEYVAYRQGDLKWILEVSTGKVRGEATAELPDSLRAELDDPVALQAAHAELERFLQETLSGAESSSRVEIDDATRARMKALGYVG
jgi:arylsulfatase A-like enzyme